MCGIGALLAEGRIAPDSLAKMMSTIRHRGPDDEGWVTLHGDALAAVAGGGADTPPACFDASLPYAPAADAVPPTQEVRVALGHRRLSILDVSPAGHQPMSFGDGRYWIVFNGEIYNHRALRAQLQDLGHDFVSHTDTEVVLAAYAEWGQVCLDRFDGMFAFVLVDRTAGNAFIARDRFGIKPLYYWLTPDRSLAIASEIKQFTVLPGWRPRVNGQRAYDFLAWSLLDHTDETMFVGVYQLPPGHSLSIDLSGRMWGQADGSLATRAWYRLKAAPFEGDLATAAESFRTLFAASVGSHLHADVPVGSCLSGGLDSSSIVCMADRVLRGQGATTTTQCVFSSCSVLKRFDEREWVEEVVRHTGVQAQYVYPDVADLFRDLDRITWHQDEPFGSTSIFAQWSVFALAADAKVKVMLDGQGADEQLAGYPEHHGANFGVLFRQFHWLELGREMSATTALHQRSYFWAMQYLANAVMPSRARHVLRRLAGKEKVTPAWLDIERLGARPSDPMRRADDGPLSVSELSYQQLTRSNLQMLLHWEDRDSMAHSIEARVPFLDHHLVEFVLGLTDSFKLHRGVTKRVLREGLKGVLPEAIRLRTSKLGFATPEEYWVREQAPDVFRQAVRDAIDVSDGILRRNATTVADEIIAGRRPFDYSLWRMISFAAWLKRFDVVAG